MRPRLQQPPQLWLQLLGSRFTDQPGIHLKQRPSGLVRQQDDLLGLGLVAALGLTRFMAGMLYEVSPTDLPTLVAVSVFLACIALLASYMPAVRATGFDPLRNLRAE